MEEFKESHYRNIRSCKSGHGRDARRRRRLVKELAHRTLEFERMQPSLAELRLTHLNLDSRDLEASGRFYGEYLGLPAVRRDGTLRVEHPSYLLVLNAGEPKVGGTFHFGFRVAGAGDVDAWIERLRSHHVPIVVEPKEAGAVYVGRVEDPDGYNIEIYAEL